MLVRTRTTLNGTSSLASSLLSLDARSVASPLTCPFSDEVDFVTTIGDPTAGVEHLCPYKSVRRWKEPPCFPEPACVPSSSSIACVPLTDFLLLQRCPSPSIPRKQLVNAQPRRYNPDHASIIAGPIAGRDADTTAADASSTVHPASGAIEYDVSSDSSLRNITNQ